MKINEITPQIKAENRLQTDTNRDSRKAGGAEQAIGKDTVELSSASRDVQKIQSILDKTPVVRAELVQGLKDQVDRGDYQVDSRKVADKMLMSILSEDFGTNQ